MFAQHFTALHGVLLAMTRRGVGADAPRMKVEQDKFIAAFHAEVAAVQPLIPLDILPRKVYKKRDANKKPGNWVIIEEEVVLKPNECVVDGWVTRIPKPKKSPSTKIRKARAVQSTLFDSGQSILEGEGLQSAPKSKAKPRRKAKAHNRRGSTTPDPEGASQ